VLWLCLCSCLWLWPRDAGVMADAVGCVCACVRGWMPRLCGFAADVRVAEMAELAGLPRGRVVGRVRVWMRVFECSLAGGTVDGVVGPTYLCGRRRVASCRVWRELKLGPEHCVEAVCNSDLQKKMPLGRGQSIGVSAFVSCFVKRELGREGSGLS
jgi:hypothetical protein